ncbi:MAG: M48 family metallopeptidase [Chloroflexota bacterium]
MRAFETSARVNLPGGPLAYTVRHSPRARRLRLVIDPRRGVVVTVPIVRRGSGRAIEAAVEGFLRQREAWLRGHLARQASVQAMAVPAAELTSGSVLRFRGEPHQVRIEAGAPSLRRSTISRVGGAETDELVVRLAVRDRRPADAVLRAWLIERARGAIEREIARHAAALDVTPAAVSLRDPRTRWGSATRTGRLSFSWRLVLAPPEALETVVVHELAHLRVFGHGPEFWAVVASRRPDHAAWRRWLREHSLELHATLA